MVKKMNYLSLFSGIGGFELGIQKSRYGDQLNCIGFSEVDESAIDVRLTNKTTQKPFTSKKAILSRSLQGFATLL